MHDAHGGRLLHARGSVRQRQPGEGRAPHHLGRGPERSPRSLRGRGEDVPLPLGRLFGVKIVLLGGDFRQIPPVVRHASVQEVAHLALQAWR